MLAQLLAVARNAFLESIRQPFYLVWLLVVGGLVILNPYLAVNTFEDDNKLATDMGLSMLLVGALLMAAFTASGVVSREIENRTALTVVSKPLPRPLFVIGKYLGVAGAIALAWWDWAMLHLLALRQGTFSTARVPWDLPVITFGSVALLGAVTIALAANYFFGRHFGAVLARWLGVLLPAAVLACLAFDFDFSLGAPDRMLEATQYLAVFFILQASLLFAAIAVACSTRLGQVPTLVIVLMIFFLGLTSDWAFGRAATDRVETVFNENNQIEEVRREGALWAKTAYAVTPNLQFHWLSDALTQDTARNIDLRYIAMVTTYTASLIVGVLAIAVLLFQTRQTT
jgi:ABC-type transport system involved in multi-copper enzyme maturation permease subunit